ncbi:ABC transporter substrate-binding protein [Demequina capsici]|uniref:Thiamine pyrimidine synthase n=1 Tax=Demequina capsici TaxID=3075620 RepID=A0AA96F7B2_9MICO|nr:MULTISPECIES: ABC transporter substrate-binding protein [unclassified Demequina]WNM24070.1 ABC transporter substrate-binding protein [Demequina sp. OYTSA14]WNM26897.1 ABC transporter substrate-binding protein [Demequina sp. PMTSA13]
MKHTRRLQATVGLAASSMLVLAGCSSTDAATTDTASDGSTAAMTTVRFTLDWTPNTNHTGLYVAIANGYFKDAGIDVEVLPYNSSSAETLIDAGSAEFGITSEGGLLYAHAAGGDVVSVMSVLQHGATALSISADRTDITSPADLDGTVYGGFGTPTEDAVNKAVIQAAGGTGDYSSVILGTSAYEALYSGDVDFTQAFVTWEGIEADLQGTPMSYFYPTDYGFPDEYSIVVAGSESWIAANPEAASAFVGALQKGYEYAAENPDEAAQILIDQNPDVLTEPELVTKSQELISSDYLLDADGAVGTQTASMWSDLGSFYFDNGLLADADGNVLTEEPDWSGFYTNDLIS